MNNRADFLRSPRTRVDMHGDQLTKWHINGALSEVPGKVQLTFSQSTQSVHFLLYRINYGFLNARFAVVPANLAVSCEPGNPSLRKAVISLDD